MTVFKKKLVQRLSCVLGAILFAIFSVFAVSSEKDKKVVSASAQEIMFSDPSYYSYFLYIPANVHICRCSTNLEFLSCIDWLDFPFGDNLVEIKTGYIKFNFNTSAQFSFASDCDSLVDEFDCRITREPIIMPLELRYTIYHYFSVNSPFSANGNYFNFIVPAGALSSGLGNDYFKFGKQCILRIYRVPMTTINSVLDPNYFEDLKNEAYDDGHYDGYNEGYDEGYDFGFNDGYDEGYFFAKDEYINKDYLDGYNEGYDEGYEDGYLDGDNNGYDYGYDDGLTEGYTDGFTAGKTEGKQEGLTEGYTNGFTAGKTEGKQEGLTEGYDEGHDDGYDEGYTSGYTNGYENGYKNVNQDNFVSGKEEGYTNGFNEGKKVGYSEGFDSGFSVGNTTGYSAGLTEGLQSAKEGSFMSLATAVVDAPIKAFLGLMDFEILGMNMRYFYLSLLTAALVIAAFRLFSGGI